MVHQKDTDLLLHEAADNFKNVLKDVLYGKDEVIRFLKNDHANLQAELEACKKELSELAEENDTQAKHIIDLEAYIVDSKGVLP